jgi:hypothetical protein
VILLHGFAETSRMWRPTIPLLAERFTVLPPDLPGIGDSDIPENSESLHEQGTDMVEAARQIHPLVRSLGVEKARNCWQLWAFGWNVPQESGRSVPRERAPDSRGLAQPMERDLDRGSYEINHCLPIEVEIGAAQPAG